MSPEAKKELLNILTWKSQYPSYIQPARLAVDLNSIQEILNKFEHVCVWKIDDINRYYNTTCERKVLERPYLYKYCPYCGGTIKIDIL